MQHKLLWIEAKGGEFLASASIEQDWLLYIYDKKSHILETTSIHVFLVLKKVYTPYDLILNLEIFYLMKVPNWHMVTLEMVLNPWLIYFYFF